MEVIEEAPLADYTRFGLGGPAEALVQSHDLAAFLAAVRAARTSGRPHVVLGGGSNLVVSDAGYAGVVLRYRGDAIDRRGESVTVQSGADLQALVDFTIEEGLEGLHTMTRIPGWVGGAIYGNAGAYGHSIMEFVRSVDWFDGGRVRSFNNRECRFRYRDSIFKERKGWVILSAELSLPPGDRAALQEKAHEIREIRDAKYPPAMRCAGSIFKNCILAELPAAVAKQVPGTVVREGKVPAAWFLEQVGAKGIRRGDIQVATYHANLIYNDGNGSADDVRAVVAELKARVLDRFRLLLDEEVQFVGFEAVSL